MLVISISGAAGPGNDDLATLTRSLGGRMYLSAADPREALDAINRFQREDPNGIVVVLTYSYGARMFAQHIAGRTRRPIDIAVFFDPYNLNEEIELPGGSVRYGFNFYQQNQTDSPWYWRFGGDNPCKGSRVKNPEFTNINLTGHRRPKDPGAKIGHNSIVTDVQEDREFSNVLNRALRL